MADYISRETAVEKLREAADCVHCSGGVDGICGFCDIENAARLIKRIPAADVEPVRHGRWKWYTHSWFIGVDDFGDPMFRDGTVWCCSNPKCRRKTVIHENFCPSCGCKMDLEV